MDEPLLSILVPTRAARAPFHPWLAWNIRKQTGLDWDRVEVVVAAPDGERIELDAPCRVRRIYYGGFEPTLGFIRNGLVMRARGTFIAWFDDDDWQAPDRLAEQLRRLPAFWNGLRGCTYLDLWSLHLIEVYALRTRALPITVVARRERAALHPFAEMQRHGSDTRWGKDLADFSPIEGLAPPEPGGLPYFLPLRHGQNMSTQIGGYRSAPEEARLERWRQDPRWNGTDQELAALRQRLVAASQARE